MAVTLNIRLARLAQCLLLHGLLMFVLPVGAVEEPPQVHFVVKAFKVVGDNPLSEAKTQSILDDFTGDHYGLEGLQAAIDALEQAFAEAGYGFYRVTFVPQTLENGVITFSVSPFHVGEVHVKGNRYYSESNISHGLPGLYRGGTPNTRELSRLLHMNNSLPSKKLTVKFVASEQEDSIDADITVDDKPPGFFFAALNNTGTDETGKLRLTGGYQYSNLFDRDHSVTLSYTLSPDKSSAVNQYGLSYDIPLYSLGSRLSFLYSSSDVDSGIVANQFAVSGSGSVLSTRYLQYFLQWGAYRHELELGFDIKKFNNNISLGGARVSSPGAGQVASHPFSLTYRGNYAGVRYNFDFSLGYAANVSGGTNNEQADYDQARVGATVDWSTISYGLGYNWYFADKWRLRLQFSGMQSSDVLIPGEQYGLGGRNSVRGFDERALLGDKGYQANVEVWMPPAFAWQIYSLVFADFGQVENNQPASGELTKETPASVGAGLRWYWKESLSVALDVGVVVHDVSIRQTDRARAHLDVFYRF